MDYVLECEVLKAEQIQPVERMYKTNWNVQLLHEVGIPLT